MKIKVVMMFVAFMATMGVGRSEACTRILYVGDTTATSAENVLRIVGRSLDWRTPIPTNLYVYPRGMKKKGHSKPGAVTWTSKYGSVYAVGYDGGVTEGMNEKGLVVNGLFCKGTVYSNPQNDNRPPMSLAMFVAWMLDQNATTPEVVKVLREQNFTISGATFDGGTVSALHWGITDAEGRCAVVEFVEGVVNVYEGQDIAALTNDPGYPAMLAIDKYWENVGGTHMLPGGVSSPDRYVRGNFFQGHVERTNDVAEGFTSIRSIMYNVSVPMKYTVEGAPNVSSTQWRSYANIRDRQYYFQRASDLGVYGVDLTKCNLNVGAPVLKLDTSKAINYVGDVTNLFVVAAPFTPMY